MRQTKHYADETATWAEGPCTVCFEVMFEELERRALPKPPALHKLIASGGRRQTENRVRFAMMYARA